MITIMKDQEEQINLQTLDHHYDFSTSLSSPNSLNSPPTTTSSSSFSESNTIPLNGCDSGTQVWSLQVRHSVHEISIEYKSKKRSTKVQVFDFNGNDNIRDNKKKKKRRTKKDDDKHPTYRGVRKRNKNPTYSTAEMAARAHDVASLAIKGHSAYLNFPYLADQLTRPAFTSPKDIQIAAAKAVATTFREARCSRNKTESS